MGGKNIKSFCKFFVFVLILLDSFSAAYAADFNLIPPSGMLGENQEIRVNLRIDSQGESINAAQATLVFPANLLRVKEISRSGSVFNFWLQEPEFSNENGTISFIGGTPNGVSGSSLHALTITFVTKTIGNAVLVFANAAITSADGTGRNIPGVSNGATLVVTSAVTIPPPRPGEARESVVQPTPVPIIREAVQAIGVPRAPEINVSLYPDQQKWYNAIAPFTASWPLPPDISALSMALNKDPDYIVPPISEGLFDSKRFGAVQEDGIYYLHVRFQNSKGWGPTAHYRIAVDTQPPLAFNVEARGGAISDNPTPTLIFQTGDTLSGAEAYLVQINQEEPVVISSQKARSDNRASDKLQVIERGIRFLNVRSEPSTASDILIKVFPGDILEYLEVRNNWYRIVTEDKIEGWVFGNYVNVIDDSSEVLTSVSEYTLASLDPGQYVVIVRAIDKAGNSIEDSVELEVLTIQSPNISFYTEKMIQGTKMISARGSALPNTRVVITLEDKDGILVLQTEVPVDGEGAWNFALERQMGLGKYKLTAQTRDDRGAISSPAGPVTIEVVERPVLVIGSIEFLLRELIIISMIIALFAAGYFWRDIVKRAIGLKSRTTVAAKKDLRNIVGILKKAVENLKLEMAKKKMSKERTKVLLNRLVKNLDKIDRYVIKDIEKIK